MFVYEKQIPWDVRDHKSATLTIDLLETSKVLSVYMRHERFYFLILATCEPGENERNYRNFVAYITPNKFDFGEDRFQYIGGDRSGLNTVHFFEILKQPTAVSNAELL